MLKTCEINAAGELTLQRAQPPEEPVPAKSGPASQSAAGIPAILKTFEFGLGQMGVVRSVKTFLKNQPEGRFRLSRLRVAEPRWHTPRHGVL